MIDARTLTDLLPHVLDIGVQAGRKILEVASRPTPLNIQSKEDHSPVTEADLLAHALIEQALLKLTPALPRLSEESTSVDFATRSTWEEYWLIDPLDGTKEFIAGTSEYTVNIALIQHNQPVLSIIHIPAWQVSYAAIRHQGSYFFPAEYHQSMAIKGRHWLSTEPAITMSRRHHIKNPALLQLLEALPSYSKILAGSSIKFCLLAEGKADIYPRFGPTSEWDTAAGQIILEEAGGAILDITGNPLQYNTKQSLVNPPFFAVADASYDWRSILEKIRPKLEQP